MSRKTKPKTGGYVQLDDGSVRRVNRLAEQHTGRNTTARGIELASLTWDVPEVDHTAAHRIEVQERQRKLRMAVRNLREKAYQKEQESK